MMPLADWPIPTYHAPRRAVVCGAGIAPCQQPALTGGLCADCEAEIGGVLGQLIDALAWPEPRRLAA